MSRRRVAFFGCILLSSLAGLGWWLGRSGTAPDPDILLITVDTLRADRLGAYGYATARTPAIDALAARGLRFTQAVTPLPRTTPALASVLTGLSPQRHGSREVLQPIDDVPLLQEQLRARGYATLGVTANDSAGRGPGLDRGFDRFVEGRELPSRTARAATTAALGFLDEARRDRPLFLWVHYVDPHAPYNPPPPWGTTEAGQGCRELIDGALRRGWTLGHLFANRDGASERVLDSCSALYDAEIAYTDSQIGELLQGFAQRRDIARTLVVFSADHGENLGEAHLYYQHGPNVHDASLIVPLIVAGPSVARGVEASPVTLEDLAPTVLARSGVPLEARPEMDGIDLSPWLDRWRRWWGSPPERVLLGESGSALMVHNSLSLHSGRAHERHCLNGPRFSLCRQPGAQPRLYDRRKDPALERPVGDRYPEARARLLKARERWPPETARERTARNRRYKLVARPRLEGGYRISLYDLESDRGELVDVAERYPGIRDDLADRVNRWAAELPGPPLEPRTPEQIELLRSLGYTN